MSQGTKKPQNEEEKPVALTKREKKILLGETTFLSLGFVVTLVLAVVYTVNIDGKTNANAATLHTISIQQTEFKRQYLEQVKVLNANLKELNTRLGRIEGAVLKK